MNIATNERLVLSAILNEKEAIYKVAPELPETCFHYGPGDLISQAHKLIYRAMLALYQDGLPLDIVTVSRKLGTDLQLVGGEAYLLQVQNSLSELSIESIAGLPQWATVVDDAGRLRNLSQVLDNYSAILDDVETALDRIEDVDSFFADLMSSIGISNSILNSYRPIVEAVQLARQDIDMELGGQAISWLPIGWESTKKYRLLQRSALTTVQGLSSIGKSQLLIEFLLGAAIQIRAYNLPGVVTVNTYEMVGKQYAKRMASCLSGVNLQSTEIQDKNSSGYTRLMEAFDLVSTLPIYYDDGEMSSVEIITQTVSLAAKLGGIHVVGIDYSELVPDRSSSEELRVSQIYRNAQALSRKLDCAVVMLSQVSGEAFANEYRIAGPWGARYSKAGWHASECTLEVYNPPQMRLQGISFRMPEYLARDDRAHVLVHKNKNGPVGNFALDWVPGTVTFSDPALATYGTPKLFENMEKVQKSDF